MSITKNSSKEELIGYVRDNLGIDPEGKTRLELLEMIEQHDDSASIAPSPIVPEPTKKTGTVTIHIPKTEAKMGDADVYVAVNQKTFLIKRGVDVEVPAAVVESLRNAVERRARQLDDGSLEHYEVAAYPFQVVQE